MEVQRRPRRADVCEVQVLQGQSPDLLTPPPGCGHAATVPGSVWECVRGEWRGRGYSVSAQWRFTVARGPWSWGGTFAPPTRTSACRSPTPRR